MNFDYETVMANKDKGFKKLCTIFGKSFIEYLEASYYAKELMKPYIIMSDEEWCKENFDCPLSLIDKLKKYKS